MRKIKHNPPWKKKSKPDFIEFSKVQQSYLNEIRGRQTNEFNEALQIVYEELGVLEMMAKAKNKVYKLKMDFSGLEIHTVKKGPGKEPPDQPEDLPPSGVSKGEGSKDN